MPIEIVAAIIGLIGVVIGIIPTYFFMRQKGLAEVEKLKAETDKTKAEADKIRFELGKDETSKKETKYAEVADDSWKDMTIARPIDSKAYLAELKAELEMEKQKTTIADSVTIIVDPTMDQSKEKSRRNKRKSILPPLEKVKFQSDPLGSLAVKTGISRGEWIFLTADTREITLGRNNIGINGTEQDLTMSREHCRISLHIDERLTVTLTDLDSANGTYLNDIKINSYIPMELKDNDTIAVGRSLLILHIYHNDINAITHSHEKDEV